MEKFRRFRQRRHSHSPASGQPVHRPKRRVWPWVVAGIVVAMGAYFWFTTARLLREPIRLEFGPTDPAFTAAMGPLVGAEFMGGNRIEMLVNGDGFFPEMLKAITTAQKTITFESYIWSSGYISNKFIDVLSERARAGVKVRIIVDGMGSLKLHHADRERMKEAGIEIYGYGREHWYEIKPNINHRTHRKLLIIDGKVGFTGGMCIDDRWLGNATHKDIWRETGARIEGPAVRQMQAVFAMNWLQTTSGLMMGEDFFPPLEKAGAAGAQCFRSGPDEGPEFSRLGYLFAIASARKSIEISHAYFVPDDLAIAMLVEARARGVRVRVIVPAINDSRFGRAAARSRWGELLDAGVEFYLYQPAMYHCKTMIVDDALLTMGSANFDNRSFSINDEVTLNILDRDVAKQNLKIFDQDLAQSKRLTAEEFHARPFYIKLADRFCGLFRSQF
ncbi:MAG TPA: cardiolipin synthase, partial [Opitutaceae bacterium]|nr:cardiolipin synthase [Opitutaceae bacterium]